MGNQRSLLFVAALTVLGGCAAVGPDYKAPVETPVTFKNAAQPGLTGGSADAAWWRQFDDPALDDLIARARAHNNDLAIAVARLRQARAIFDGNGRDRWPSVTAVAGYDGGRTSASQTLPGAARDFESYSMGFDAAWEIDLFGHVSRSIEAAKADAQAAEAGLRDVQVTVAGDVARNYFNLRGAQRRLAVAQQNLENERETLRITQARYDAGRGTELELASATARVEATEASVPPLVAEGKRAEHRLAILTGARPGELAVDLGQRDFPPMAKEIPIGRPEDLLRRRPDIRIAERNLAAATARVGVATADLFPRLSLTGTLGFVASRGSSLGKAASESWFAAPTLSWAAFDLGRAKDRLHANEAVADQQLAAYRQTVLLALEETENAFVNYGEAQRQLEHLLEQARYSARAAQLAQTRYREGVTDFLTLLDAQRTELQAEDAVAQAETQVYAGVVAIYKALGGGWQLCGESDCPALAVASGEAR
jgi:multidrug efflux system outer membrane protein